MVREQLTKLQFYHAIKNCFFIFDNFLSMDRHNHIAYLFWKIREPSFWILFHTDSKFVFYMAIIDKNQKRREV